MTAEALVAVLEARGARLEARGDRLVISPRGVLTAELREALVARKPDVLAHLRARALGTDWSKVSLRSLDQVLEVAVPWSDVPLILAPGCRIARALRAEVQHPGRVWCTCEVIDLLLSGVTAGDVRAIAQARELFDAELAGVRKDGGRS